MKKIKHLLSVVVAGSMMFFAACQPEEDEPTPADDRDKVVGTWSCAETSSQNGSSTYEVHIKKATASSQVTMENFYNYGFNKSAIASVSGSSLTIASQSFSGTTVQGSGTATSSTKINMNYTVNDGSSTDTVTAVLTKK